MVFVGDFFRDINLNNGDIKDISRGNDGDIFMKYKQQHGIYNAHIS